jgi:hypothetical protein
MKIKNPIYVNILLATVCLQALLVVENVHAQTHELKSPNEHLSIVFETVKGKHPTEESEKLVYSVNYNDKALVDKSALSLNLENQRPLGEDVKIVDTERTSLNQSYELIAGKTNFVNDTCNVLTIHLQENGKKCFKEFAE